MGVGAGLYMYDVVVKKFTVAISSPDEFLFETWPNRQSYRRTSRQTTDTLIAILRTL